MDSRKTRLKKLLDEIALKYKDTHKSRSSLARAMGIPIQVLGSYCRGDSFPDRENFLKIAQFLGISTLELEAKLDGRELPTPQSQPQKAEDVILIAAQLPNSEKLALLKYLANTLEYA